MIVQTIGVVGCGQMGAGIAEATGVTDAGAGESVAICGSVRGPRR